MRFMNYTENGINCRIFKVSNSKPKISRWIVVRVLVLDPACGGRDLGLGSFIECDNMSHTKYY